MIGVEAERLLGDQRLNGRPQESAPSEWTSTTRYGDKPTNF
ncbi:hypothetical protein [Bacillus sp. RS11]